MEGEELARLAVEKHVGRTALNNLLWVINVRKDVAGVESYIRMQSARDVWGIEFARYLLDLLRKCGNDLSVFSKIVAIAHSTYEYYRTKPVMEALLRHKEQLLDIIRAFLASKNLGKECDISIRGKTLKVFIKQGIERRKRGDLARQLQKAIKRRIPALGRVKFNILFERVEV
ncbi:MAG: hypothetical protein DRJ69_07425 [Thermoprotei archaeon]|nr:MAG: hypothetical protein DRJ69_07425 [Thermoprotei archaeon]